jgi:hypothetical protein
MTTLARYLVTSLELTILIKFPKSVIAKDDQPLTGSKFETHLLRLKDTASAPSIFRNGASFSSFVANSYQFANKMDPPPQKQIRPHTEADFVWSRPFGLVEKPGMHINEPEAWVYCDKFSYEGGETVSLKTHTTAETYDIEIIRDGFRPTTVFLETGLPGRKCSTPPDAYATGCG